MSVSKTPFAQAIELLPCTSFARITKHNSDNAYMRRNYAKKFHVIALAQSAWRAIEVTLGANSNELYHDETLGRDLPKTVYVLHATTIDL